MPNMTRTRAQALLNKREMVLYDDSRLNGLRKLDPAGIAKRVALAREARDRARDLLQRQKLALRAATGSKRGTGGAANQRSKDKVGLLADILVRFREHAPVARRAAAGVAGSPAKRSPAAKKTAASRATGKAATKPAGAKKAATKKAATKKAATKKAATKKAATKKAATKTATTKKAATKKAATKKAATTAKPSEQAPMRRTGRTASTAAAKSSPKMPTARKALANTRKLLRAKQAEARAPKSWQSLGTSTGTGHVPHEGYQSPEAAVRAAELHDAEMHRPAQLGAVSSHVRRAQGRRDGKGGA